MRKNRTRSSKRAQKRWQQRMGKGIFQIEDELPFQTVISSVSHLSSTKVLMDLGKACMPAYFSPTLGADTLQDEFKWKLRKVSYDLATDFNSSTSTTGYCYGELWLLTLSGTNAVYPVEGNQYDYDFMDLDSIAYNMLGASNGSDYRIHKLEGRVPMSTGLFWTGTTNYVGFQCHFKGAIPRKLITKIDNHSSELSPPFAQVLCLTMLKPIAGTSSGTPIQGVINTEKYLSRNTDQGIREES